MKHGENHRLHDKFLYNLIYNIKRDEYSLEEQDEYFEKLEKEKWKLKDLVILLVKKSQEPN